MKLLHSLLAAALFAAASTNAAAQSTTGVVNIGGSIVPSSCTVTMTGGGIADYGTIAYSTLNQAATKALAAVNVNTEFECTGPTLFAFTLTDNKIASNSRTDLSQSYGLGETADTVKIGFFVVNTVNAIRDGAAATLVQSSNKTSWSTAGVTSNWNRVNGPGTNVYRAFGSGTAVDALTEASIDIAVEPIINSRNVLKLTQDATLDGNATLEITYL